MRAPGLLFPGRAALLVGDVLLLLCALEAPHLQLRQGAPSYSQRTELSAYSTRGLHILALIVAQVLNALLTAILPGLALKIFVKLLPGLLALLNRHSGEPSSL